MSDVKSVIESGRAVLGIEFGSTRIKAVLIGEDHAPIATGAHDWENMLVDGIWTYSLDMIWEGISDCYSKMAQDAKEKYGACKDPDSQDKTRQDRSRGLLRRGRKGKVWSYHQKACGNRYFRHDARLSAF